MFKRLIGLGKPRERQAEQTSAPPCVQIAGQGVAVTPTDSCNRPAVTAAVSTPVAGAIMRTLPRTLARRATTRTEAHSVAEHARALLSWLQGDGGATGMITARELQECHSMMLAELDWSPASWQPVAMAFRNLIGTPKQYAYINRVRTVVYNVPTAAQMRERGAAAKRPALVA